MARPQFKKKLESAHWAHLEAILRASNLVRFETQCSASGVKKVGLSPKILRFSQQSAEISKRNFTNMFSSMVLSEFTAFQS